MIEPIRSSRPLTVLRGRGLKGRFRTPGEPGIATLSLLLGATARGETVTYADTASAGPDVTAALRLIAALGARVERHDDRWQINGLGPLGLLEPEVMLECGGASRLLPLAMGLLGPYAFASRLVATGGNMAVPRDLNDALRGLGVEIEAPHTGQLPLTLKGPRDGVPAAWRVPTTAGAASVTAMLLAALGLPGLSRLTGIAVQPHHSLRLLRHFGAEIAESRDDTGAILAIRGLPALGARTLAAGGDPDLAALAIVAALTVPGSDVLVENMLLDKAQFGLIDTLVEMGGSIEFVDRRQAAGEEVVDLRVMHSPLLGTEVGTRRLVGAGVSAIAIAGAFAAGSTHIPRRGGPDEAALHRRLAVALAANGAIARADANGLTIGRPPDGARLGGATVETGSDPLFAAAMLVFGLAAPLQVTLTNADAMRVEWPGLIGEFESLGGEFYRRDPA